MATVGTLLHVTSESVQGAHPGTLHRLGCDVEQCPYCGHQLRSCEHFLFGTDDLPPDEDRLPWTGEWPGEAEAREFGWYCKRLPAWWDGCRAAKMTRSQPGRQQGQG